MSPARTLANVDFPEPFSPIIAVVGAVRVAEILSSSTASGLTVTVRFWNVIIIFSPVPQHTCRRRPLRRSCQGFRLVCGGVVQWWSATRSRRRRPRDGRGPGRRRGDSLLLDPGVDADRSPGLGLHRLPRYPTPRYL